MKPDESTFTATPIVKLSPMSLWTISPPDTRVTRKMTSSVTIAERTHDLPNGIPMAKSTTIPIGIPKRANNLWLNTQHKAYTELCEALDADNNCISESDDNLWQIKVTGEGEVGITEHSAGTKLVQFIHRRDVHVVFHGPNQCHEKRYWNKYTHFHLTYVAQTRPGVTALGITSVLSTNTSASQLGIFLTVYKLNFPHVRPIACLTNHV